MCFPGLRWCWLSCVLLFPFLLLSARILKYCIMNYYSSHFALQSYEKGREKTYIYRLLSVNDFYVILQRARSVGQVPNSRDACLIQM
ncbi:hypothetical protein BJY01DRAFT_220425 [Aspergillus pseudoustus]|uniref:Secreted protein n=1 Tax=Aspergillus pseudoustus TaxID=1810923 RepID=A0ABR4JCZ7_9EURO